ncbi:MAG: LamG domain-containing protein [Planctomycetaceae bacterium]|nr:LamG domain-containing protein [Planctomycetaceae bacterium]
MRVPLEGVFSGIVRFGAGIALLALPLLAQSTVPPNLVGQWHFDEGAGTTTVDSAGSSTGTLTGTVAWVPGLWGTAVRPDGSSGFVNFGSQAALNVAASAPFSIAGWINIPASETAGPIVSLRHSVNDQPVVDICVGFDGVTTVNGNLQALVRDNSGAAFAEVSSGTTVVNDGAWHHFALTRNAGSQIELFLDGVSRGTSSAAGSGGAITTDRRAFGAELRWIQVAANTANQQFLNGTIEEVQFYARQLSSADIQTLAAPPAPTGLAATGGNGTVDLSWNAAPTATSYVVKRGTAAIGPFSAVGSPTSGTTFTDGSATNGTTWFYVVDAVNGTKTSADSNAVSATPVAPVPKGPPGDPNRCGCGTAGPANPAVFFLALVLAAGALLGGRR